MATVGLSVLRANYTLSTVTLAKRMKGTDGMKGGGMKGMKAMYVAPRWAGGRRL